MTLQAGHLSDHELLDGCWPDVPAHILRHLSQCAVCRDERDRLAQVLQLVDEHTLAPPHVPGPGFEREVWARLQPQLAQARKPLGTWMRGWLPRLALAGGVTVLVLAAFVAGRYSTNESVPADRAALDGPDPAGRMLVLALVDHLDRSQMVLLEVINADAQDVTAFGGQQQLARELVTSSRLYRRTATTQGDERAGGLLDDLERVLLEVANAPPVDSADDIDALRARLTAEGVLFKLRVVHAELRERERQTWETKGRS